MRYGFSGCVLDAGRIELRCGGELVHVEPQVFDVLRYLVEHAERVVSREELLDEVWGSRFVTESALTSRIKAARRAVGDDGDAQSIIRTQRGRGYRLVAPVAVLDDPAPEPAVPTSAPTGRGRRPPRPLPQPTSRVVGRSVEVDLAVAAADRSRLVTIVGTGGVGKTTLAMLVASRLAVRFGDGAFWCDWAAVTHPSAAVDALADALGITHQPDLDARSSVVVGIGARRILVVADNCEHLVDNAAELLGELVAACPNLTVLATSRSPLSVPGEALCALEPLPCGTSESRGEERSTAATLFVERALAADARLAFDGSGPVVETLCRRLDGLPLALELAAARLRSQTLEELAEQVAASINVAAGVQRGRAPRHQTLQDTIDWSYRLLDGDERWAFELLWVFSGTFTAADARELVDGLGENGERVPALLDALVDHSVLVADRDGGGTRFRMLETLRAYAQEVAGPARSEQLRRAHACWALELAEQLDGQIRTPAEAGAVRRFDQVFADLRSALNHAVGHGDVDIAVRLIAALYFYTVHRLRDEVVTWSEAACRMPGAEDHPAYQVAHGLWSQGLSTRGELARSTQLANEALAACGPDDPRGTWALRTLSNVSLYEGRLDDAAEYSRRELALAAGRSDGIDGNDALIVLILACAYAGNFEEAEHLALIHRRRAEGFGNPSLLAWANFIHGEVKSATDPAAALELLEAALAIGTPVASNFVIGVTLVTIASTQARMGDVDLALSSFERAIDHWYSRGDWVHQWTTLRNIVGLLAQIGRRAEAAFLLGAVSSPGIGSQPYGQAAADLEVTRAELEVALGAERFASLFEQGRRASADEAVVHARAAVSAGLGTQ